MSQTYDKVAIVGLGLIGSSVARAAMQYGAAQHIVAYDSNPLTLQLGQEQGFVHEAASSIEQAVADADLIVLAMPPTASMEAVPQIAGHLKAGALVTDVLSVKYGMAECMKQHLAGLAVYVPSHPIAGSEKSGAAAGRADLFAGKSVILTPETPDDAGIARFAEFWQALGAQVEFMPPDVHDMVYAHVSHLPQLLAFAFKPFAAHYAADDRAAPGFNQFTRLCSSDEHLWQDIFTHNKAMLDMALARFIALMTHIRDELLDGEEGEAQAEKKAEPADAPIDDAVMWTAWVPRMIASCLVATIAQQSKDSGLPFQSFAGSGFADFTAPLAHDPEADMETIAKHAPALSAALDDWLVALATKVTA